MFYLNDFLQMILEHIYEGSTTSNIDYIIRLHEDNKKIIFNGSWKEMALFMGLEDYDWRVVSIIPDPEDTRDIPDHNKNMLITVI